MQLILRNTVMSKCVARSFGKYLNSFLTFGYLIFLITTLEFESDVCIPDLPVTITIPKTSYTVGQILSPKIFVKI